MNTVFIADDELIIRQGIKCIIDWEQLGFEIIGEASNGEDALNFILPERHGSGYYTTNGLAMYTA